MSLKMWPLIGISPLLLTLNHFKFYPLWFAILIYALLGLCYSLLNRVYTFLRDTPKAKLIILSSFGFFVILYLLVVTEYPRNTEIRLTKGGLELSKGISNPGLEKNISDLSSEVASLSDKIMLYMQDHQRLIHYSNIAELRTNINTLKNMNSTILRNINSCRSLKKIVQDNGEVIKRSHLRDMVVLTQIYNDVWEKRMKTILDVNNSFSDVLNYALANNIVIYKDLSQNVGLDKANKLDRLIEKYNQALKKAIKYEEEYNKNQFEFLKKHGLEKYFNN